MNLDKSKLTNLKGNRARCPACAAEGHDRDGNHLYLGPDGKWGCAKHPGDKEHRQKVFALVGIHSPSTAPRQPLPTVPGSQNECDPRKVMLPTLRRPTCTELSKISSSRNFPVWSPLEFMAKDGMLFTATMMDGKETVEAWILADSSRRAAQARRIDGKLWSSIGGKKAKTLAGSLGNWPVGVPLLIKNDDPVFLCEGGPDALAVEILAWLAGVSARVIAVFGAGASIHPEALPYFRGQRVRIVEQNDESSTKAGCRWARQIHEAGARVDGWNPPAGMKDVADLLASFSSGEADPISDLKRAAKSTGLFANGLT